MKTLGATHPHFVRCIIPNEIKTGGIIDAHLVMHQLHCNGVLEGIRICRKGFPSRIIYLEFVLRYSIINPTACKSVNNADEAKKATAAILETSKLDPELFRMGLTKVLFKAGVLGTLEEQRDAAISGYLIALQSNIRTYLNRKNIQKMIDQKNSISALQRNIKAYLELREWGWWTLMSFVKPLLGAAKREEERLAREAEERRLADLAAAEERRKAEERAARAAQIEAHLSKMEANCASLEKEKEQLHAELASQKDKNKANEARIAQLEAEAAKFSNDVAGMNQRIAQEEEATAELRNDLIRESLERAKVEKIRHQLEGTLRTANSQIENIERHNSKLENLIKRQEEEVNNITSKFEEEHTELVRVTRRAQLLQEELTEAEAEILRERSAKNKSERQRTELARKLEELDKELEHSINAQAVLNDTRIRSDNEINKLKQEIDNIIRKHESAFTQLRAVHEETVNEMSGRISQLIRAINKLEKEKIQLESEYGPARATSSRRF
jgi:myosin heavy subunit